MLCSPVIFKHYGLLTAAPRHASTRQTRNRWLRDLAAMPYGLRRGTTHAAAKQIGEHNDSDGYV